MYLFISKRIKRIQDTLEFKTYFSYQTVIFLYTFISNRSSMTLFFHLSQRLVWRWRSFTSFYNLSINDLQLIISIEPKSSIFLFTIISSRLWPLSKKKFLEKGNTVLFSKFDVNVSSVLVWPYIFQISQRLVRRWSSFTFVFFYFRYRTQIIYFSFYYHQ